MSLLVWSLISVTIDKDSWFVLLWLVAMYSRFSSRTIGSLGSRCLSFGPYEIKYLKTPATIFQKQTLKKVLPQLEFYLCVLIKLVNQTMTFISKSETFKWKPTIHAVCLWNEIQIWKLEIQKCLFNDNIISFFLILC